MALAAVTAMVVTADDSDADPTIIDSGPIFTFSNDPAGTWILYSDGLLLIDITDNQFNFTLDVPWKDYREDIIIIDIIFDIEVTWGFGPELPVELFSNMPNLTTLSFPISLAIWSGRQITGSDNLKTIVFKEGSIKDYMSQFGFLINNWKIEGMEVNEFGIGPITTFSYNSDTPFRHDTMRPAPGKTLILGENAVNVVDDQYNNMIAFLGYVDDELVILSDPADRAGRMYEAGVGLTWVEVANIGPEPTPDTDNSYTLVVLAIIAVLAFTILAYFGFGYIGSIVSFILGALAVLILFLCGVI